ncbi:MAG: RidA family protein [Candidatus Koribacter versatilis]|uniref:RidA family protein n=1 Tax=Candidatus Korobacter versatilis TaxID=658062 RepID=A0A932A8X6_9BACT|nr:RidA family protein [Candidatus Koribacter versatilis]
MMKEQIVTKDAPAAIGPYSQAIRGGGLVFCSGQVALDPATDTLTGNEVRAQTERVMKNLEAVLKAAGTDFTKVVRSTIYLKTMNDFAAMNEIYASFFPAPPPARATVEVARLPKDALVEIDVIALA